MNRPYGVLSKQEGVIKGETRSCPLEIASARSAGRHVSTETCAIENPTTACVGTLRKHAGGMFLVPTTAAVPRGGNREGRGTRDESHHRLRAVPLKVNCREAAREATLGCPLTGEAMGDS